MFIRKIGIDGLDLDWYRLSIPPCLIYTIITVLLLKIKTSVLSIEFYKILRCKLKATNMGKKNKKKKINKTILIFKIILVSKLTRDVYISGAVNPQLLSVLFNLVITTFG